MREKHMNNYITTNTTTTTYPITTTKTTKTTAVPSESWYSQYLNQMLFNPVDLNKILLNINLPSPSKDMVQIFLPCNIVIQIPIIIKAEILNPNKVLRFTFSDKTIIKTICDQVDSFDFEYSFYLAYAKYLYGKTLTTNGIEKMAKDFKNVKAINKLVQKNIKMFYAQEKEKEKQKQIEAEKKAIKKRRREKRLAKRLKKSKQ